MNGSEKLRDCARGGRAVPIIASLFHTTLRAWQEGSATVESPLQAYLKDRMPIEIPGCRRPLIENYGVLKEPMELRALLDTTVSTPVRVGVVHGDLHSLNILVRNGEAIVIDFEKVANGEPLLLDLATLEAGLLVDGFIGDRRNGAELLKSIKSLYQFDSLVGDKMARCDPSDGSAWFFDCIRQIRLHARRNELASAQYALTLATELAKKACSTSVIGGAASCSANAITADRVRALAYVLAQRILVELDKSNASKVSESP